MPANIENLYTYRQPAWHGIGYVAQEVMDLPDALRAAGMEYDFSLAPIQATHMTLDGVTVVEMPNRRAVLRTDRNNPSDVRAYGPVSDKYAIHSIEEMFGFATDMLGEGAVIETIGTLGEGERAFITLTLPVDVKIANDKVGLMMTGTTSFDGSAATQYDMTSVRIVCANTWAMAHALSSASIKFRHTSMLDEAKQYRAADALGLAAQFAEVLEAKASALLATSLRGEDAAQVISTLFPFPGAIASQIEAGKFNIDLATPAEKRAITKVQENRRDVYNLYTSSPVKAETGTGWGLFNAVTEWADHFAPIQTKDQAVASERRFSRITTGQFDNLKDQAAELILAGV